MPAPRDRAPTTLEQRFPAFPLPPLSASASAGFEREIVDIRWSSPSDLQDNTGFSVLGANIYRSFDSQFGPYVRLNAGPLGARQWRDRTQTVLALREDVSNAFTARGAATDPRGRYMFRTRNKPIVIHPSLGSANCTNLNVQVTVNGAMAFVEQIFADTGVVELRTVPTFDVITQQQFPPVLPSSDGDVVLATYKYLTNRVKTDITHRNRIFYRITTVALDSSGALVETPLERAVETNLDEVEKLDYIWTEAIRRNLWILFQGGERVKLFTLKEHGAMCGCMSGLHGQPSSDCGECFGTGFLGGYDGPFDIIVAPDDSAKRINQTNRGRTMEHSYETWTGPRPLISQRDFLVKLNGDRYGVGPVRMPSNRGMQLQQMFSIGSLDEADIRFKVPVPDPNFLEAPRTRYLRPDMRWGGRDVIPIVTDHPSIPDEREERSNTVTGDNITRG